MYVKCPEAPQEDPLGLLPLDGSPKELPLERIRQRRLHLRRGVPNALGSRGHLEHLAWRRSLYTNFRTSVYWGEVV